MSGEPGHRTRSFCPYVGLAPYTLAEREYFFGREKESRLIAANLRASALCVFYGASGVGKSSVLMAGAIPELETRTRTVVVVYREWQHADLEQRIARETWAALRRARARLGEETEKLDAYLARAEREPAPTLDELLAAAAAALRGKLLLVLDQFEEYPLYHAASADAASFDAQLARAVNRDEVGAGILISLREDQLAALDRFRARIPNLFANTIRLEAMDEAAATRALTMPIETYRASHPGDPVTIEGELVSNVISQVATGRVRMESRGSSLGQADERRGRVEAPFLQLVMTRLWQEEAERGSSVLRAATLAELGGASGIVKGHLDRVLAGLTDDQRDVCSRFFDRLVTPSGSKVAYPVADLAKAANAAPEEVVAVIAQLTGERRVLRNVGAAPGQAGSERVEIYHDVLAGAVLDWQRRFGAFREQEALRLSTMRRVRRNAQWALLGIAIVALGLGGLAAWSWSDANRAREAEQRSKEEEQRSKEHANALREEASEAEAKRDQALAARDQANADLAQATGALESAKAAIETLAASNPTATATTATNAIAQIDQVLRPRLYVHGLSLSAMELVKKATPRLEKSGLTVADFRPVKEVPYQNELRYFRAEDEAWANRAIAALGEAGLGTIFPRLMSGYGESEVRPGTLELWLGAGRGILSRPNPPALELKK